VAIGDLAVLRDHPVLFGAPPATAWRVLASVDDALLDQMKTRLGRC
jgi:hypothetical protein